MGNEELFTKIFLKEFIRQLNKYKNSTLGEYKVVKIEEDEVHIKKENLNTNKGFEKSTKPYFTLKIEQIEKTMETIINKKKMNREDLNGLTEESSFLWSLLSEFPLFKEIKNTSIILKTFTTRDLPSDFNLSFTSIFESSKVDKKAVLQAPFFSMIFDTIKFMQNLSSKLKRDILLETIFITVNSSKDETAIKESVAKRRLSNTLLWMEYFHLIDDELNVIEAKPFPQIWWVNQGKTQEEEFQEGSLWAPKKNKAGISQSHHTDLMKAKVGDIVIAYANKKINYFCLVEEKAIFANKPSSFETDEWEREGILLKVKYISLTDPIKKEEIPRDWKREEGPFDKNGDVKQGYFYKVSKDFYLKLIKKFHTRIPNEFLEKQNLIRNFEMEPVIVSDKEMMDQISHFIHQKGLYYDIDDLKNFFLSIKSKPFVILSGISGTGKTKLVQLFAESIGATSDNGQFKLIPVRPDWSDGTDLLGYIDLKGEFRPGALTEFLQEAGKLENRNKPYFLLLDEMNLARVEYYFSELLSIMETKKFVNGMIQSDPVLHTNKNEKIRLYNNIYFIGTVNMDETTHPFSKKVLDRANTIEFNDIDLEFFDFLNEKNNAQPIKITNDQIAGKFLTLKDAYFEHKELIHSTIDQLIKINQMLDEINSQFGYRVRDEICFYMIYNAESQLLNEDKAFDYQIMQKVLPRITGSDEATINVLKKIFKYSSNINWNENLTLEEIVAGSRYPKTAKKVFNMIKKREEEGFTSFWQA
ncbi:McrB family protein [Fervidibacillus albus]|uniref:AAA family ATPase n=1 Tax=Fervidibacillus albus TaxID=2980026 RepID=A0A9E8LWH5_9BACI|nr:AAA family ATPase [Fervidibacillus albus]WAA10988.1 AAA family ATPase [Fervidibacillus albus]